MTKAQSNRYSSVCRNLILIKMEISNHIKFSELCKLFEKIQKAEGVKYKEIYVQRYMENFKKKVQEYESSHQLTHTSFYCVLRCLLPNADTARESYGIRVNSLGRIYVKVLNLNPESDDAQKLLFKNVSGDYADIVYEVMKSRANSNWSNLSLGEVHRFLDLIAADDRRTMERELISFVESTCALEQKWFTRLLLKKMNLGLGEHRVFSIFHPKAKELYTRHTSLEKVCDIIEKGGEISIEDTVAPFSHIRPMLCERLNITKLEEILRLGNYFVETKMDGERFQLHLSDEVFKYVSRNGIDYTKHFGKDNCEGNLTPLLSKQINDKVQNIILDGEMMVFDKSNNIFKVKGENIDVKHLPLGGNLRPCFVVYDLLYLNGRSYLDSMYSERINLIQKNVTERVGILKISKPTKILTLSHFMDIFNKALDSSEEGVVIKKQMSTYKPGSRVGGWYKVKADYIDGVTSDFDLLIIGGFYNKSKTYIESFLLGVQKPDIHGNPKILAVGKIAMGLSQIERRKLNGNLNKYWKSSGLSDYLEFGNCRPDVWIEPNNSTILQIRASELSQSNSYATAYTLRFPRIESIRNDKTWNECMSLEEFESFYESAQGVKKVNKRSLNTYDFLSVSKKSKHIEKEKSNPYKSTFQQEEVRKVTNDLSGENFCILSNFKSGKYSIEDIKAIVIKNGGNIVENPLSNSQNCICVAGDLTIRAKALKSTGLYNIVSLTWLIDNFADESTATDRIVRLRPKDMICSTPEMDNKFKQCFDRFGDSFTDPVNSTDLRNLLDQIPLNDVPSLVQSEIAQLESEMHKNGSSPNIFRDMTGHFYSSSKNDYKSNVAKLLFKFKGGTCSEAINCETLFVFVNPVVCVSSSLKGISNSILVSVEWILDCERNNILVEMEKYILNKL